MAGPPIERIVDLQHDTVVLERPHLCEVMATGPLPIDPLHVLALRDVEHLTRVRIEPPRYHAIAQRARVVGRQCEAVGLEMFDERWKSRTTQCGAELGETECRG